MLLSNIELLELVYSVLIKNKHGKDRAVSKEIVIEIVRHEVIREMEAAK